MGLKSIVTKPAYYVSDNSLLLQIGCRGVSPVLGFTRTTQYIPKSTTDPEWCLPFSTYPYLFLLMIFQTNFFRLIMSALKFHLPTSWTGILWNKASFVECLAHANGVPVVNSHVVVNVCMYWTVPFHKFHKTVANRVTHLDTGWPPFAVPERSRWLRKRRWGCFKIWWKLWQNSLLRKTSTALSSLSTAFSSQTSLFRCCTCRLIIDLFTCYDDQ